MLQHPWTVVMLRRETGRLAHIEAIERWRARFANRGSRTKPMKARLIAGHPTGRELQPVLISGKRQQRPTSSAPVRSRASLQDPIATGSACTQPASRIRLRTPRSKCAFCGSVQESIPAAARGPLQPRLRRARAPLFRLRVGRRLLPWGRRLARDRGARLPFRARHSNSAE